MARLGGAEPLKVSEATHRLGCSPSGFELADLIEFTAGGLKAALLHGADERIVNALAKCGEYELVVRGHLHQRLSQRVGGCLVVNPGEACGYLTGVSTLATLDTETLRVEFHEL